MLGIWRLQLLREVARRGTLKAAAQAMSITPSAVSQQLRILELEAGAKLLEPHGRLVRLTDAGRILVRHADTITAAIAAAEADLAATQSEVVGTLSVAAIPTAARAIMPRVLTALGRSHPKLKLMLRDLESSESLLALQMDEVDLAIFDEYDETTRVHADGIETIEILRDPLHVALAPGSDLPMAGVALADLRDQSWIMDTETSTIFQVTQRACRRAGFDPQVRSHCRDYSVILALVGAGLGVGVVPGLALYDRVIRARVAPLQPPLERIVVAAIRSERRSHPAVAALLAELAAFVVAYGNPDSDDAAKGLPPAVEDRRILA
jgi:DNA-binding transcriptional LysR family regulator